MLSPPSPRSSAMYGSTLPHGGSNGGSSNNSGNAPRLPFPLLARAIRLLAITSVEDGVLVETSNDLCRILNYSSPELVGRPFVDLVHPEDRLVAIGVMHRLCNRDPDSLPPTPSASSSNHHLTSRFGPPMRSHSSASSSASADSPSPRLDDTTDDSSQELFEVRCMCKDGAYRWMWWEASLIKDSSNRRWIIAIARDVTQMHRLIPPFLLNCHCAPSTNDDGCHIAK
jgi:hypothetical protein